MSENEHRWYKPTDKMPDKNVPIEWQNSSGEVIKGKFIGVWMMDSGMYIYYTPTFWRYTFDE